MRKLSIFPVLFCMAFQLLVSCNEISEHREDSSLPGEERPEEPLQTVGVNFNGQFDHIDFSDLDHTHTGWVRGFTDFFQLYPEVEHLDTDQRLANYLTLKRNGYRTILSIKWDFSNKAFPDPESEEMQAYKEYLRKFLEKVWNATDILVIGNEPFIESRPSERDQRLVAFYKEIAREVKDFQKGSGNGPGLKKIPLYIGAFNNLYLPSWRTPAVEEFLAFAKETSWIAGVDLHIHHSGTQQLVEAMDYVNDKIRDNQKILITEYSLMKHWKLKMGEQIPVEFAERYERDPKEQNYQYIDYALKNQVSKKEWDDFLSGSYWFWNKRRYLWNSYQEFKNYEKFHIATYAVRQSYPLNKDFTVNTDPWILNALYANRTVQPDRQNGDFEFNLAWIDDFRAIQQEQN